MPDKYFEGKGSQDGWAFGPRVLKFDGAFGPEGCGIAFGHTFGVKVLKMDRPTAGGFLSLTALRAEGCGLPLRGNAYEVSVTGLAFCIICDTISSATYFLVSP